MFFFVPLGALLSLRKILNSKKIFGVSGWIQIFNYGCMVSLSAEILQVFTLDRHSSVTDLFSNIIGHILGITFIFIIFLKFFKEIDAILNKFVLKKPELTISIFFIVLIFILETFPFDFYFRNISLSQNIRFFAMNKIYFINIIRDLPLAFILYGSLTYFGLMTFWLYFSKNFKIFFLLFLFFILLLIPIFIEIWKLFLPSKYSAITWIISSQVAVIFGYLAGLIQIRKSIKGIDSESILKRRLLFFLMFTTAYLCFFISHNLAINSQLSSTVLVKSMFKVITPAELSVLKSYWLNLLILFARDMLVFLPAGFIFSNLANPLRNQRMGGRFFWILLALVLIMYYSFSKIIFGLEIGLIDIFSAGSGIILGCSFWFLYLLLLESQ
jgi:VanZ family protein